MIVLEEGHPFFRSILVSVDHMRRVSELHAATLELLLRRMDIRYAQIENRVVRSVALLRKHQSDTAQVKESEPGKRIKLGQPQGVPIPDAGVLDAPHSAGDLREHHIIVGQRHRGHIGPPHSVEGGAPGHSIPQPQFLPTGTTQFGKCVADVELHGVKADAHPLGNLSIGQTVTNQLGGAPFSRGEHIIVPWSTWPRDHHGHKLAGDQVNYPTRRRKRGMCAMDRRRWVDRLPEAINLLAEETGIMALTVWTYDWVPKGPRGFVRDMRLRWALEEAGLSYEVRSTPFEDRGADHYERQPFGQVPFLTDGDISLFESGACLLHLAKKSEKLMPRDEAGAAETLQWVIAGLNSIEMVTVPWWFLSLSVGRENGLTDWTRSRLDHIEKVLRDREWLVASRFTVADLLMADILRVPAVREFAASPVIHAYIDRACDRDSFRKAHADQIAHFQAADTRRATS